MSATLSPNKMLQFRASAASPDRAVRMSQPSVLQAILLGGCVIGIAAASLAIPAADAARSADADLATLLRGMAVIKALLVAPMVALLLWRFRSPVSKPVATIYLLSLWTLAPAVVLIWKLEHVIAAAVLFHLALFAFLIVALRDDGLLPARLRRLARS